MTARETTDSLRVPRGSIYLSVFAISASVILWELLLTRIYGVIFYYHFAFVAVSVAMFGLTLGALLVFTRVRGFCPENVAAGAGYLAALAGLLMAVAIAVQLSIPLHAVGGSPPPEYLLATYTLSSLPFIPAGGAICLLLTQYRRVAIVYAADLIGAGAGCAVLPALISTLGGPGAVMATGAICCVGGFFALCAGRSTGAPGVLALAVLLFGLGAMNGEAGWVQVRWRHSGPDSPPLYESWNAFSRIIVTDNDQNPFGWGIDPELQARLQPIRQLWMEIDSGAGTPITSFTGDLRRLEHLRYDVSAFAHHLRPPGQVCVIGAGGGRDVLTALVFGHRRIRAIEVNPSIIHAVNHVFGDFTGHLDRLPQLEFTADEGRSYLSRTPERFDIIQASFVDTAAATAAGAYAFTENGLYTVEGWKTFLEHLRPGGVLTFSRFYYGSTTWPVEVYRLTALAGAALRSIGITDPARHVLLVRTRPTRRGEAERIATIAISRDPFSQDDLRRARSVCEEIRCEIAFTSQESIDPNFTTLLNTAAASELARQFSLDVTPPHDDHPFFFFHAKMLDVLLGRGAIAYGGSAQHAPAVQLLLQLTALVILLAFAMIVLPVLRLRARGEWQSNGGVKPLPMAMYFSALGLGFMFVEIGLMQRASIFLGHPIYGFTVALLGLLVASGIGSALSERVERALGASRTWWVLAVVPIALASLEGASRAAFGGAIGAATEIRIGLALLSICPAGLMMGLGFPVGMRFLQERGDPRAAWYWGVNGATSVVATVLAMIVSLNFGISATIWCGIALYAAAAFLYQRVASAQSAVCS